MTTGLLTPTHVAILLIVVLLILGPKRLPQAGRALGQSLREFKHGISGCEEPQSLILILTLTRVQRKAPLGDRRRSCPACRKPPRQPRVLVDDCPRITGNTDEAGPALCYEIQHGHPDLPRVNRSTGQAGGFTAECNLEISAKADACSAPGGSVSCSDARGCTGRT